MTTIQNIAAGDQISSSRSDINSNFANLNSDKIETSVIDTDTAMTADSDDKIPTQKAVKAYVESFQGQTFLVPTGAVLPYGGSSAPANFLLCDGTAVSRSTYSTLFGVVSTTYGVGDGSTTFNLPNLSGRVPMGAGTGTKVATFASRASNVITVTGLTDAANNEFQTGQAVLYTAASGAMTGLTHNTTYYIIRTGNLTFSLATSLANAQNGTVISLSSDGTGTQTFTLTLTTRTAGATGGEENHAMSSSELLAHTHSNGYDTTSSGASRGSGTNVGNTTGSTGGNTSMNNIQPFVVLNYIIRT
jgi:microcystin-dependent protein